jgi:hypothetical protein
MGCWLFSNTKYLFKQRKGGLEDKLVEFQEQGCLFLPSLNTILLVNPLHSLSLFLFGRMEGVEGASSPNEKKGRFKRICVFCGSRPGYKSTFSDAALELGKVLVMYYIVFILSFLIFLEIFHVTQIEPFGGDDRLIERLIWFTVEEVQV